MSIWPAIKPEVKDSGLSPKGTFGSYSRYKFISALIKKQIGQCRVIKSTYGTRSDSGNSDNYIEVNKLVSCGYEEMAESALIRLDVNSKLSGDALMNRFATVCRLLSVNNIKYQWNFCTGTSITVWPESPKGKNYKLDSDYEIAVSDFNFGIGEENGCSYWVDKDHHSKGYKSLLVEEVF